MIKFFKQYSLWIGSSVAVMGIVAGIVANQWIPIPLILIMIGSGIISWQLINLLTFSRQGNNYSNGVLSAIAIVIIAVIINLLIARISVKADLTENKIFTLSPQSQQLVNKLNNPLKVWVFSAIENPSNQELLNNYRKYGSQFSFEFVDPQVKPNLAQRFQVSRNGEVYLEYGQKRQLIQTLEPQETISEIKLTTGIYQIISDRQDQVYFLQGHGEYRLDNNSEINVAIKSLNDRNFLTKPLDLTKDSAIPQDAKTIIIANPRVPLNPPEITQLTTYLQRGGSLLLMADYNISNFDDQWLEPWGVKLGKQLIIDDSGIGEAAKIGVNVAVVHQYGKHPITSSFNKINSIYPNAQAINLTPINNGEQTPLLKTIKESWAESEPTKSPLEFNEGKDQPGPLNIAVAVKQNQTRLVVIGNAQYITGNLFNISINGDLFLNSISWLSKRDDSFLSIRPKETINRRLQITPNHALILFIMPIIIAPLVAFSIGTYLWWKRSSFSG